MTVSSWLVLPPLPMVMVSATLTPSTNWRDFVSTERWATASFPTRCQRVCVQGWHCTATRIKPLSACFRDGAQSVACHCGCFFPLRRMVSASWHLWMRLQPASISPLSIKQPNRRKKRISYKSSASSVLPASRSVPRTSRWRWGHGLCLVVCWHRPDGRWSRSCRPRSLLLSPSPSLMKW